MTRLASMALALLMIAGCGSDGEKTIADGGPDQGIDQGADQGIADQGAADQGTLPGGAWAISAGSPESDNVSGIAVDSQGNSTVIGSFTGSLTLGTKTLTNGGGEPGGFVTRLDPEGKFVWAVSHGGWGAQDVALDSAGNAYVGGDFDGTAAFGSTTLTGTSDLFVAKLDPSGNFLWAVAHGGGTDPIGVAGIAVDGQGNSYITGGFFGTATLGTTTLTAGGVMGAAFVAKLDVDGNVLWAKAADKAMAYDIAVDSSGNSYVVGGFHETASFGSTTLTVPSGLDNTFVAKLDADGNFLWVVNGGGTDAGKGGTKERGEAIAVDGSGNAHVTGICGGASTFGSATLPDCGSTHGGYVAKLDSSGSFVWAVPLLQPGGGIALDSAGNSYVTDGQVTLAVKLDPSGKELWSVPCPDDPAKGRAFGAGIGVDNAGHSYVAGWFIGTISVGAVTLKSKGLEDLFVVKLPADGSL